MFDAYQSFIYTSFYNLIEYGLKYSDLFESVSLFLEKVEWSGISSNRLLKNVIAGRNDLFACYAQAGEEVSKNIGNKRVTMHLLVFVTIN